VSKVVRKSSVLLHAAQAYYQYGGATEAVTGVARIIAGKLSIRRRRSKWLALQRVSGFEPIAIVGNARLQMDPQDEGIAAELFVDRTHEPFATALLMKQIRAGMTVVDAGSNVGYYVVQEEPLVGPTGKIFAIEPGPRTFQMLSRNVELNALSNVKLIHGAVSDHTGTASLYVSNQSNISRLSPRSDYVERVEVPLFTIDDLVADEPRVDIVRMDIEGHEVAAQRGMLDVIRRHRPLVCVEIHFPMLTETDANEYLRTFDDAGYELKAFVFRWADNAVFGKFWASERTVYKRSHLLDLVGPVRSQTIVAFIGHKEKDLSW